jgi:tRNA (guanine-N7-)-methyltransferase
VTMGAVKAMSALIAFLTGHHQQNAFIAGLSFSARSFRHQTVGIGGTFRSSETGTFSQNEGETRAFSRTMQIVRCHKYTTKGDSLRVANAADDVGKEDKIVEVIDSFDGAYNNSLAVISSPEEVEQFKLEHASFKTAKFRQHVNPLARKFQAPCHLPISWPQNAFYDCSKKLYLDIGCGKGGFLLHLAGAVKDDDSDVTGNQFSDLNFFGLEIRPPVAEYAASRVSKKGLQGLVSFVGCNVNIDLERLLSLYQREHASSPDETILHTVSIQFPDPHFKERHKKRKVVTQELIQTLAKHMAPNSAVFLQSDVQNVLDDMRQAFREENGLKFFYDEIEDSSEYLDVNPVGIPTEREISVLENKLPVFRTVLRRNMHLVV